MDRVTPRNRQNGAALVIGLLLLVIITVLAVSGMNTATTELAIARNDQGYENAFQAAETGLEQAIAQGAFNTETTVTLTQTIPGTNDTVTATIECEEWTIVPDKAFSLGAGSGIAAYHFLASSQAESRRSGGGTTDRDSSALHTQAFYVVAPEPETLTTGC
jgi:type IV pilus assembly protein PilX